MTQSYLFNLFADYFQLYLQDEEAEGSLENSWTPEAINQLLALAPGIIGIGTVRDMTVPLSIEIVDQVPDEEIGEWDQINECSIEIPSGRFIVSGCSDYLPEAPRISVTKGTYRARIYYGKLNTLRENGLEGDDHYKVIFWKAPLAPLKVIKQR